MVDNYFTLFVQFIVVAIVPGPLALIAFNSGTANIRQFVSGLSGQLIGLTIMCICLISAVDIFPKMLMQLLVLIGSIGIIVLGILMFRRKKPTLSHKVAFGTTLTMAFSNPKAILGFGVPLVLFHAEQSGLSAILGSLIVLYVAVGLTMFFYFLLGTWLGTSAVLVGVRKTSALMLCAMGMYFIYKLVVSLI